METTLIIMAAGIGSRFGKGIKQLTPVGPSGEIIMDYSIHDAFAAGFDKVLFIIRKDIEEAFREMIGDRLEQKFPGRLLYAYQEGDDLPAGFKKPADRTKPWGTGHAILACREILKTPALIINADDYYGKIAYRTMHDYLVTADQHPAPEGVLDLSMAGYVLKNTLSDNGSVTRGLCETDRNGFLTGITETSNILKDENGNPYLEKDGVKVAIPAEKPASMNMWGITPAFMQVLEEKFVEFLSGLKEGDLKSEYLLPDLIGTLLKENRARVKVLESHDRWFGVTYQQDRETVIEAFRELVQSGEYPSPLF